MINSLLERPFDQYQRYRDVQEIADILRDGDKPFKALDMGGHPGVIRDFLTKDKTTIVDILPADGVDDYHQIDGSDLPFKDASFDLVCSLDALEHVLPGNREKFISEMIRVSNDFIVLICPFYDEDIKLAEEITFEFYNKTFNTPLQVLGEHLQNGLPHLEEIKDFFKGKGLKPIQIPSGYLFNWLPMQIAKIYVQSLPDAQDLHQMIDKFYNKNYYEVDHKYPSYRTVLVASKKSSPKLAKVLERFNIPENESQASSGQSFDTFTMLMSLFDLQHKNQMQSLVKEIETTHKTLREKDVHIANLDQIISDKDAHIKNLENWVSKVQQAIPYKIYASVKRLRKSNDK